MGEFKEDTIDRDAFEDFAPTTHELDSMQKAAALGHVNEIKTKLEEKSVRMKYYKESMTIEDIADLLEVITDIERTLE
jgi:predicted house-cleaning noncanonical NTP pyrophosphatase (MazG superfamily)